MRPLSRIVSARCSIPTPMIMTRVHNAPSTFSTFRLETKRITKTSPPSPATRIQNPIELHSVGLVYIHTRRTLLAPRGQPRFGQVDLAAGPRGRYQPENRESKGPYEQKDSGVGVVPLKGREGEGIGDFGSEFRNRVPQEEAKQTDERRPEVKSSVIAQRSKKAGYGFDESIHSPHKIEPCWVENRPRPSRTVDRARARPART